MSNQQQTDDKSQQIKAVQHCSFVLLCRALDFDDLLSWPVALLEQCPAVRDKLQKRYKHILVDEFQDTNAPQYELVRQLAGNQVSQTLPLLRCHAEILKRHAQLVHARMHSYSLMPSGVMHHRWRRIANGCGLP